MKNSLDLGLEVDTNERAVWANAPNPSIAVFGQAGQGKTTLLMELICQASLESHIVILDCAGDFCAQSSKLSPNWPPQNLRILDVRDPMVPICSFSPLSLALGITESEADFADRIAGIICDALNLRDKQFAYIYECLAADFKKDKTSSIKSLLNYIEMDENSVQEASTIKSRLQVMADFPSTNVNWSEPFRTPGVTVVDVRKLSTRKRRMATELFLSSLWCYKVAVPDACSLNIVMDECQTNSFSPDAMTPKLLHEGRKHSIGCWLATQSTSNKKMMNELGQAALQIFFKPEDQAIQKTAIQLTLTYPQKRGRILNALTTLTPGFFFYIKNGKPILVHAESTKQKTSSQSQFIR